MALEREPDKKCWFMFECWFSRHADAKAQLLSLVAFYNKLQLTVDICACPVFAIATDAASGKTLNRIWDGSLS